jgi:hypothetical protein
VKPDGTLGSGRQIIFVDIDGKTYDMSKSITNVVLNHSDPIETTGGDSVERNLLDQLQEHRDEIKRLQQIIIDHAKTCTTPIDT